MSTLDSAKGDAGCKLRGGDGEGLEIGMSGS
jgi:hypothetical protein